MKLRVEGFNSNIFFNRLSFWGLMICTSGKGAVNLKGPFFSLSLTLSFPTSFSYSLSLTHPLSLYLTLSLTRYPLHTLSLTVSYSYFLSFCFPPQYHSPSTINHQFTQASGCAMLSSCLIADVKQHFAKLTPGKETA